MDCFFVVLKCRVCEIFRTFRFSRFLHVSFFKSSTFRFAGFKYTLPFGAPKNNYAYKFRQLLEKHIADNLTVNDYAEMTGVSRICLNKNVKEQFGTTVSDMIRSRMVEEIKSRLLFSGLSVKEVAFSLHFSEPNHMMRFFKSQTGQTVCEFVSGYQNGSIP